MALAFGLGPASADDLTLRMPEGMIATGFDKQILPRFKFKHRIAITPVTEGEADMVFGAEGTRVFQRIDGDVIRLEILIDSDAARTFRDWLKSGPGKAAIETFKPDGTPVYTTQQAAVVVEKTETYDGDKE
ncbi:MAG: hypothetical protein AAF230_01120, partial [Pseudomonadota bacterium]